MKVRRIAGKLLLLGIVLSTAGCGSSHTVEEEVDLKPQNTLENFDRVGVLEEFEDASIEETPDYIKLYQEVLEGYRKVIESGGEEEIEGASGVVEAVMGLGTEEALKSIGYIIQDVSGDGIPELLIGECSEEDTGLGTMIYALYHCANGIPECTFEGWYRNSYHWMGDGKFTYSGSGGAIYSMFGTAALSEDGTALEWHEYYFTHEKDENFEEIGCYYNTTGEDSVENSEELTISFDEFWDKEAEILEKRQWMQLIAFSESEETLIPGVDTGEDSSLYKVRKQIAENGDVCAVGYLGYFDGSYYDLGAYFQYLGIVDGHEYLMNVDQDHFIDQEGYELYVVIPAEDLSVLVVNEYVLDDYESAEAAPGEELGRFEDGRPVLMRGNISEIVPNLYLEAETREGAFVAYNPCLSMRDGSLNSSHGVYDITPYEALGIYKEPVEGEEFMGSWSVVEPDRFEDIIILSNNGEASYRVLDDEGELMLSYYGSWEMADGEMTIVLWDDLEAEEPVFFGTYIPEILYNGKLCLTLTSGDALSTNMYYDGYEKFSPSF